MKYRADIDGLRALAVLSVVGFHYSLSHLVNGGYVGVDIFFVISGFLITRIIYDDINSNTYSIVEFYHRRVRRIFPALFTVLIVALSLTFLLRFPSEMTDIGRSVAASIFFVSNIFFYRSSSYFDDKLTSNPTLHTWSLSVEEQFYIIFPILIYLIKSLDRKTHRIVLTGVFLICMGTSAYQVYFGDSTAAFYLVSFRAWELLTGSLIAIGGIPRIANRFVIEGISLAGIAAIMAAVVSYDKQTHFPGLAAVLPCFGSAAIIYAGACGNHLVGRVLALPPIRFIGLISYSLYLWHWPLLVFALDVVHLEGTPRKLGLVAVAVALATLSWWFVERPARTKPYRFTPRGTLALSGGVMVVTAVFALCLGTLGEHFRPASAEAEAMLKNLSYPAEVSMRDGKCFLTSHYNSFTDYKKDDCLQLSSTKKNVLIIGDSHAAHLWAGYETVYPQFNFMQATASGCKPVPKPRGDKRCTDLMHFVFDDFLPNHHVDVIVLAARWRASDVDDAMGATAYLKQFADRVALFGPIVEYSEPLPRLLARELSQHDKPGTIAYPAIMPEPKAAEPVFAAATLPSGVVYISMYSAVCHPDCLTMADQKTPLQFDYGHLTREGSALMIRQVGPRSLGLTP